MPSANPFDKTSAGENFFDVLKELEMPKKHPLQVKKAEEEFTQSINEHGNKMSANASSKTLSEQLKVLEEA